MSACSAWSQAPRQASLVALPVAWVCPAAAGTEDCGMGGQAVCGAYTGRYGVELEHLSAGAAAASRSDRDASQGSHRPTPRTQPPRDAVHSALLPAPQRLPERWCPAAPRPAWGRTCGQVRRLPRHAPSPPTMSPSGGTETAHGAAGARHRPRAASGCPGAAARCSPSD
jgi:hypothetical protein